MAEQSLIGWTGATWNPLVGCSLASAGCRGCYAMGEAWRKMHHPNPAVAEKFAGTAMKVKGRPVWTGRVNFYEPALMMPLRRRKPQVYFVNSLSDLFHEGVPTEAIDRIFAVMALAPQHTFQVLTKRAERMSSYLRFPGVAERIFFAAVRLASQLGGRWQGCPPQAVWPLPNVWLGVSAEDQRWADQRIPSLLASPAAVRFVSCEPLLGPIDLRWWLRPVDDLTGKPCAALDWVIAGYESGPRARARHPSIALSLRDQCAGAGTAFFFKQWGAWAPQTRDDDTAHVHQWVLPAGAPRFGPESPAELGGALMVRLGAKAAGNILDGAKHEALPNRGCLPGCPAIGGWRDPGCTCPDAAWREGLGA